MLLDQDPLGDWSDAGCPPPAVAATWVAGGLATATPASRPERVGLEIGPDALTYRGYRTDVTWPWSQVHGARIQARGPAGVLIDVRGAGKDPVVPITAFAVPAEQLLEEIERAQVAARR